MLPAYSPELQTAKKSPPKSFNFFDFLYAHISSHPWLWIFVGFVLIPSLITAVAQKSPMYRRYRSSAAECPSGRVYVYDLPSMFNDDLLLHNCTDLDPWNWQCGIVTNQGLGGAAAELRRILPEKIAKSWRHTNQFALELIFHHRLLRHKCRTLEPESAAAFYIPFYAGLAVGKYLWNNDTAIRDHHCLMLLRWVQRQNYWRKSNGSDHFIAIGRITWDFRRLTDNTGQLWGSAFLDMPEMQNVTRFIIERNPDDDRDVGVPYPTGFHPETGETLKNWQRFVRGYNRTSLFTFIGAARGPDTNDFRGLLLSYCKNESSSCRAVDCATAQCSADSSVALESFLGSDFCLQPVGDSATRRSVFDCMIAGSVPVFFWTRTAYEQYGWFLPAEPGSYSVFIDPEEVRNRSSVLKEVLMRYSKEEIRKMREKVIEIIPRIIYGIGNEGSSDDFKDAFDIAVDGVLERIKKERGLFHVS